MSTPDFFRSRLDAMIDLRHPLAVLATKMSWASIETTLAPLDETYIRVKGEWRHLYRAVDKDGNTIDFLLRAHRDKTAARRYFEKSIAQNGVPETVTIDKSGANLAALEPINAHREAPIKIRQSKYLNNLVAQDHRAIKRRTRPMLDFILRQIAKPIQPASFMSPKTTIFHGHRRPATRVLRLRLRFPCWWEARSWRS